MISCSDSRVEPSIILNCNPGDLFTIRSIANLVPPSIKDNLCSDTNVYHGVSAALEYGICFLQIKLIIVLGHTNCGGIKVAANQYQGIPSESYIKKWMSIAEKSCKEAKAKYKYSNLTEEEIFDKCGEHSLINSYKNLITFDHIKNRYNASQLDILIWNFDIKNGIITQLNKNNLQFESI